MSFTMELIIAFLALIASARALPGMFSVTEMLVTIYCGGSVSSANPSTFKPATVQLSESGEQMYITGRV